MADMRTHNQHISSIYLVHMLVTKVTYSPLNNMPTIKPKNYRVTDQDYN